MRFLGCTAAVAAPLSGTKSVGPAGDYASLTAAIADIQAAGNGLGGALLLELKAGYVGTVETYPLTIPALNGASADNTLTIRPASGATGLSLSAYSSTYPTVDLHGAQYVTFDGRPGGVGTVKQLTIANTYSSGVALRFINEASKNKILHTTLRSVNTGALSGTVVFSNTTGANGNDDNLLDYCDICDGATTPANGIYAEGNGTTTAKNNSGNTISNCNIFNFHRSLAAEAAGLKITSGNTLWTISGNSFYQTASRAGVNSTVRAIYLSNTSNHTHTVTGNFIGGSAPNAGGTAWTTTGLTEPYRFVGIWLRVSGSTACNVHGNVIKNFYWRSSSEESAMHGVWSGIHVETGRANIGTVAGNTIGSGTGTGSVTVIPGDGGTTYGITSESSSTVNISNNTIGSITAQAPNTGQAASLTGIEVNDGTITISNNLVGSTTTANSLNADTSVSDAGAWQTVAGIQCSSTGTGLITDNTVANLNNRCTLAVGSGSVRGITTAWGTHTIRGNTIRNLTTGSLSTSLSAVGIWASANGNQTVSQNVVHSLTNNSNLMRFPVPNAAVTVSGIYFYGTAVATSVVEGNLVHSLVVTNGSATSEVHGLWFGWGTFTARNNMVRVGLDATGASPAGGSKIMGIRDSSPSSGRRYHHNSVYVGGEATSGSAKTFALSSNDQYAVREYLNNIFVNARGNNGGTGKHYAIGDGGVVAVQNGMTSNNNIFFVSGSVFGYFNNGDRSTLAAWRTATGQDAASVVVDPLFLTPAGTAANLDLHVATNSPAKNAGLPIAGVTTDFDGEIRSIETPTLGADEIPAPNIAVRQASVLTDGVSSVNFGSVGLGSSSAAKTFTITNTGGADLASLAVTGASGEFVVSALSGSTVPAGPGSVTFTVTFSPAAVGARSTVLRIASNVVGAKNPFDITLNGTGLTEQEGWRLAYFGSAANSGAGADAADFDHDGMSNLAEYIAGVEPNNPASVFKWCMEPVPGEPAKKQLVLSPIVAGRTYLVKVSSGLGTEAVWTTLTGCTTTDNGSERTITNLDITGGAKFYRVEITRP